MSKTRVAVLDEVSQTIDEENKVCFQKVIYQYGSGGYDEGFRFINRSIQTNNMKSQMGQCRLPSKALIEHLLTIAEAHGMFK